MNRPVVFLLLFQLPDPPLTIRRLMAADTVFFQQRFLQQQQRLIPFAPQNVLLSGILLMNGIQLYRQVSEVFQQFPQPAEGGIVGSAIPLGCFRQCGSSRSLVSPTARILSSSSERFSISGDHSRRVS